MDEYADTIVGGRDGRRSTSQNYPPGLEVLLKTAKADPCFRAPDSRLPNRQEGGNVAVHRRVHRPDPIRRGDGGRDGGAS
jgi:hypothetical protein